MRWKRTIMVCTILLLLFSTAVGASSTTKIEQNSQEECPESKILENYSEYKNCNETMLEEKKRNFAEEQKKIIEERTERDIRKLVNIYHWFKDTFSGLFNYF